MNFQPTPAHIEWLGIFVVLTAALHFAERVWSFINKIINDCQRRKQIEVKRRAQQEARLAAKRQAAKRLAAKIVPMPPAAIGSGDSPANNSASQKSDGETSAEAKPGCSLKTKHSYQASPPQLS